MIEVLPQIGDLNKLSTGLCTRSVDKPTQSQNFLDQLVEVGGARAVVDNRSAKAVVPVQDGIGRRNDCGNK